MLKLPDGFVDLMPGEAEAFHFVRDRLIQVFQLYGYRIVVPPSVELIDTFLRSGEREINTFNFIDHAGGSTACFRYDFTPQIARMAASLDLAVPQRLCYDGPVLRNPEGLSGAMREIFHAGAEIIGVDEERADAEIVTMILRGLRDAGCEGIRIFLNDGGIAGGLFGEGTRGPVPPSFRQALLDRDVSTLRRRAAEAGFGAARKKLASEICFLCGDAGVLDEAASYGIGEIEIPLERLRRLYDALDTRDRDAVSFDLGEIRGFEYHTGIVFDCYARDRSGGHRAVATGGRYDGLLERYCGKPVPATGCAADLLGLSRCAAPRVEPALVLVHQCTRAGRRAAGIVAERLRDRGVRVTVSSAADTEAARSEIASFGASAGIFLDGATAVGINARTGSQRSFRRITGAAAVESLVNFAKKESS